MIFYKETKDLITCKERRVNALFEELLQLEQKEIHDLFIKVDKNPTYYTLDKIDEHVELILSRYGEIRNQLINYYYPESETKSYEDVYDSSDDE